jgi:hypothetical protein
MFHMFLEADRIRGDNLGVFLLCILAVQRKTQVGYAVIGASP